MDVGSVAILLAVGALAGFLAGAFGAGGGIILVPFLIWFFQANGTSSLVSVHLAFGTSLCVLAFTSAASAAVYQRREQVIWRAVPVLGLASVVGAVAGGIVGGGLEGTTLRKFFAVMVVAAAVRLLTPATKGKKERDPSLAVPGLAGTGVLVGLASGLSGSMEGMISVPLLTTVVKFPIKKALGTSSAFVIMAALAASATYAAAGRHNLFLPGGTLGFVDPLRAAPIVAGAIPAALAGMQVVNVSRRTTLTRAYAIVLLIIAFKMFFF